MSKISRESSQLKIWEDLSSIHRRQKQHHLAHSPKLTINQTQLHHTNHNMKTILLLASTLSLLSTAVTSFTHPLSGSRNILQQQHSLKMSSSTTPGRHPHCDLPGDPWVCEYIGPQIWEFYHQSLNASCVCVPCKYAKNLHRSLILNTNVDLGEDKGDILKELSALVAKSTGKPESYVGEYSCMLFDC